VVGRPASFVVAGGCTEALVVVAVGTLAVEVGTLVVVVGKLVVVVGTLAVAVGTLGVVVASTPVVVLAVASPRLLHPCQDQDRAYRQ